MAFTPKSVIEQVEALYIGYFGRAGEPAGVQYWIDQIQAGRSFAQVAAAFSVQAEAKAQHPFLAIPDIVGPAEFVESLYLQLFGRQSDLAGKTYWVSQLTAAQDNPFAYGLLIAQFISGAQGDDVTVIQNKIDAAKYFTSHLGMAGKYGVDASGHVLTEVDNAATSIIGSVTKDAASVAAANLKTDGFLAGTFPEPIVVPDQAKTFILTPGPDLLTGTTKGDLFIGVVDADGGSLQTFSAVDQLDGGDGIDRFNILFDTASSTLFPVTDVKNIEQFYLRNISGKRLEVDFDDVSGETEIWNDRSTSEVMVSGLNDGAIFGLNGNTENATGDYDWAQYKSTATNAVVTLANGTSTRSNVIEVFGIGLTTLTINSVGAANGVSAISGSSGSISSIRINAETDLTLQRGSSIFSNGGLVDDLTMTVVGAGRVDLQDLSSSVGVLDARQNTGGIVANLYKTNHAFLGGSGNDVITTARLEDAVANAIDGGEGRDTLVIGSTSDHTGGRGAYFTGFEILDVASEQGYIDNFINSTFDSIRMGGSSAYVGDVTAALAQNITIYASGGAAIYLKDASGPSDTIKIDINNGSSAKSTITLNYVTAVDVENIEFTLTDNLTLKSVESMFGVTDLKFSGAGNLDLTLGSFNPAIGFEIDAGGVLGTTEIDASDLAGIPSITIRAGSGGSNIIGTDGADQIFSGSSGGTYNGGFGGDTINLSGSIGASDIVIIRPFESWSLLSPDRISGFTNGLTNSDTINLDGTSSVVEDLVAGTPSNQADITVTATNGMFTFGGSGAAAASLQVLRAVVAYFLDEAGETGAFIRNGNTYLVNTQTDDVGYGSEDIFVELTGMTTAIGLSTTAGANLIHIA